MIRTTTLNLPHTTPNPFKGTYNRALRASMNNLGRRLPFLPAKLVRPKKDLIGYLSPHLEVPCNTGPFTSHLQTQRRQWQVLAWLLQSQMEACRLDEVDRALFAWRVGAFRGRWSPKQRKKSLRRNNPEILGISRNPDNVGTMSNPEITGISRKPNNVGTSKLKHWEIP